MLQAQLVFSLVFLIEITLVTTKVAAKKFQGGLIGLLQQGERPWRRDQAARRKKRNCRSRVHNSAPLSELGWSSTAFWPSRSVEARTNDEIRVFSSSLGDLGVKVNDVQRLTSFTLAIRWMSIALGVVARMTRTPSVKTKPDFERHGAPHQSSRALRFPFTASATRSDSSSETESSRTATKEQKPFTGIGRSSSTR